MEQYFTQDGVKELEIMATKGAQNASESLSKLVNQNIQITTVSVRSVPVDKLDDLVAVPEENIVSVSMELSGDVGGQIMLIYPHQSAINVSDFLLKRPLGSTKELDESDKSALSESANIIAGAFLASISNYLKVNMIESIPNMYQGVLKDAISSVVERFKNADTIEAIAMSINFNMATPELAEADKIVENMQVKGYFILLLDNQSAAKVLGSLKNISGGKSMTL